MKAFLLWMLLSQGADTTTTLIALNRGCREAMWPIRHAPYVGLGVKTGATITLAFTLPWHHKAHPKASKWAAGLVAGAGTAATAWNLTQLGRCR